MVPHAALMTVDAHAREPRTDLSRANPGRISSRTDLSAGGSACRADDRRCARARTPDGSLLFPRTPDGSLPDGSLSADDRRCARARTPDGSLRARTPDGSLSPADEPTCGRVRGRYLEFLDHNLRETCTNWSERDDDCAVQQIDACGLTLAFALRALVDEEPMAFGGSFGLDNCHVCTGDPRPVELSDHPGRALSRAPVRAARQPDRLGPPGWQDDHATRVSHLCPDPAPAQTAGRDRISPAVSGRARGDCRSTKLTFVRPAMAATTRRSLPAARCLPGPWAVRRLACSSETRAGPRIQSRASRSGRSFGLARPPRTTRQ